MQCKKIALHFLPKQYGGRINANTFKATCATHKNANDTSAWLQGIQRLDTEGSLLNDNITSIIKSLIKDTPVIVKIQEPGRLYQREIEVMQLLSDQNIPNIIYHICDFTCKDDIIRWKEPLEVPRPFCRTPGENNIHIIVMEYIEHNLKNELRKRILPENIIKNIAKQLMYVVLQLWYQFKITHGDLHEGNILLDIGDPIINTYKIGKYTRHVNTLGYEPIIIDFQFASIYKYKNTKYTFNEIIQRQPLFILEIFRYYISNFQDIYNNIASTKTLEELLATIDAI